MKTILITLIYRLRGILMRDDKQYKRDCVINYLAMIASKEFYDRYCFTGGVGATYPAEKINEYAINDALAKNYQRNGTITKEESDALVVFFNHLNILAKTISYPKDFEGWKNWADSNNDWLDLQNRAEKLIKLMGYNLKKWEDENIKWAPLERPERYS